MVTHEIEQPVMRGQATNFRRPDVTDERTAMRPAENLGPNILCLVDLSLAPEADRLFNGHSPIGGKNHPLWQNLTDENGHSMTPLLILKADFTILGDLRQTLLWSSISPSLPR